MVTLFATGALNLGSGTSVSLPPPANVGIGPQQFHVRAQRIVQNVLGPGYPNPKRLIQLLLLQVHLPSGPPDSPYSLENYRSLYIEYRLLDHPLRTWRLRTAKSEVFSLLRALYTSGLPIYDVELDGRFMLPDHGKLREERALLAYVDRTTADSIPWKRWGRDHENQVWSMLPVKSVDPRFG